MQDSTLEELRKTEQDGLIPVRRFRPGDKVDLVNCAFVGWSAIFQGMLPKDRCLVMLSILGQQTSVNLSLGNIVRATAA
jgi:transcription antitermination factor NusG